MVFARPRPKAVLVPGFAAEATRALRRGSVEGSTKRALAIRSTTFETTVERHTGRARLPS